jgi:hypothetical protein
MGRIPTSLRLGSPFICSLTAAYAGDFERSKLMKFKEAVLDVMESKPCNIP